MKKNIWLLSTVFVASTAAFVACSSGDEIQLPAGERVEVKFTSNIVVMDSPLRASGNQWEANDVIGIYMLKEEDPLAVVENKQNVPYSTKTEGTPGSFGPEGEVIYFPDNGDKVRFMSYYPYQLGVTDNIYKVDVSTQEEQSQIDLLYSFNDKSAYSKKTGDKKVPLTFNHQLTKIIINVNAGDGLTSEDLADLGVYFSGMSTKADFNLFTGSLSDYSVIEDVASVKVEPKPDYVAGFEAIVLPVSIAPENNTIQMVFDLNNGDADKVANDTYSWNFNSPLESGKKYIYNVRINRSGIVVTATINDWIGVDEEDVVAE